MKRLLRPAVILLVICLFWASSSIAQTADKKGSSDPALFPSRMPGFYITTYDQSEFEAYTFPTGRAEKKTVEGKLTRIIYTKDKGTADPGGMAVLRNYENAIVKAGGKVVYSTDKESILKINTDKGEVWAEIKAAQKVFRYFLTIVECKPMEQVVTAEAILDELNSKGFIALYILFDFNKAEIKPESKPIIDEIAEMLRKNPAIRVSVEGHTDNIGSPASNKKLSLARAEAVVRAVMEQGISKDRMTAVGYGEEQPIADNSTEEGRAQNRRVVLVKK